jgi:hypothetical protein
LLVQQAVVHRDQLRNQQRVSHRPGLLDDIACEAEAQLATQADRLLDLIIRQAEGTLELLPICQGISDRSRNGGLPNIQIPAS